MVRAIALRARAPVALTFAVAVLSIVTGIANIGTDVVVGPLAPLVPPAVRQAVGFTGTLTGFVTIGAAFALRRGYRAGWFATVALLPVTAVQGLLQSSPASLPLVVASVGALPVVVLSRGRFDREIDLTPTQLASAAALLGSQAYGTLGTFALRDQFAGVDSLTDAFYFTIVTGSTVGYGDITPQTDIARLFGVSVLLVSVASFAVALGVLLTPAIEARFARTLGRMTDLDLDRLDGHVLVLGYGDLTDPVLDELHDERFVVVTPDAAVAQSLRDRDVDVLTGDPSDEDTLERAGVDRARAAVAATNDDAADALSILTARALDPELRIVAAATHRENVSKLRRAGATAVLSPATIGGRLLVRSALGEATDDEIDRLVGDLMREPSDDG